MSSMKASVQTGEPLKSPTHSGSPAPLSADECRRICVRSGVARFIGFIDYPFGSQILFESSISESHSGLVLWMDHQDSAQVFNLANIRREVFRSEEEFLLCPPVLRLIHARSGEVYSV